ncbi:FtsX-like permease family protein [Corynebacterium occultum]|uniref:FtsX-like permease family protein n=1 Tax=Corynebacterium occultum TaxID=2675219 RepID=A0A6B8W551_9CORY|nr:ABC transporter permease [Corynebacterium occultum]QGU07681.1 FtsX-like permease family protein [Corynebacterium occultum]
MLKLALAQLRRRTLRYLSLFFSIFAAVAITVATAAITSSLTQSVNQMYAQPYAASDVVVTLSSTDRPTVDAIIGAFAQEPAIGDIAFDQSASAAVEVSDSLYDSGYLQAISEGPQQWRTISEGRLPLGPGEVMSTDPAVQVGTQLQIRPGQSSNRATVVVVGKAEPAPHEEARGLNLWLADPQAMAEWFPDTIRGEIRIAGAGLGDSPEQLAATVESTLLSVDRAKGTVATSKVHGDRLAAEFLGDRSAYFMLLGAFLAVVAVVAALVIFSSYLVIASKRQREYALLRAIGGGSGQLTFSVILEAVLLSVLGCVLGVPTGYFLAGFAIENANAIGVDVPIVEVVLEPAAYLIIGIAAVLLTVAAALPASRRVLRSPVVASLQARGSTSANLLARTLLILIGVGLIFCGRYGTTLLDTTTATETVVVAVGSAGLAVMGVVLLVAGLLPWLLSLLSVPLQKLSAHLGLAASFAGRQTLRSASLVAILVAATALVSAVLTGQERIGTAIGERSAGESTADVVVTGVGETLSQPLVDQLQELEGVAAVAAPPAVTVTANQGRSDNAFALSKEDAEAVIRQQSTGIRVAGPNELILGEHSDLRSELVEGSVTSIEVFGNPYEVTVLYDDGLRTMIDADIAWDAQEKVAIQRGVPVEQAPELPMPLALLRMEGAADQASDSAALNELRDFLAGQGQQVALAEEFSARSNAEELAFRMLTISTLLMLVSLIIAAVGIANTVALSVRDRARDRAILNSVGVTPLGQQAALGLELLLLSAPAALIGSLVGSAFGSWIAAAVVDGQQRFVWQPATEQLPLIIVAAVVLTMVIGALTQATAGRSRSNSPTDL